MVTLAEILNAVSEALHEAFPNRYCYIGQQPTDFERPSLFLELVTTHTKRHTIGTRETTIFLMVTLHEPLSLTRKGDQLQCLEDMERVLELFGAECLRTGGRTLQIQAESGGQDGGEGYVDLCVICREGVGYDPEAGLGQMQSVNMVLRPKEEE